MSIDDQILIGSAEDYRIVFKTYCAELDSVLFFEEKPQLISLLTKEWDGSAHPCSSKLSIDHFEPVVGFKPTMSVSFCLRKTHATAQRNKLVYALFPFIQKLGCEVAYAQDFYEVIVRYKEGQLEIKTQTHFWQHNDLEKIPIAYTELPDLFF